MVLPVLFTLFDEILIEGVGCNRGNSGSYENVDSRGGGIGGGEKCGGS